MKLLLKLNSLYCRMLIAVTDRCHRMQVVTCKYLGICFLSNKSSVVLWNIVEYFNDVGEYDTVKTQSKHSTEISFPTNVPADTSAYILETHRQ